jgi:single-stranded DNA-binding protein
MCEVEAPGKLARQAEALHRGAEVLVAGQLSERAFEGERGSRRTVLLASLIHAASHEPGAIAEFRRPTGSS